LSEPRRSSLGANPESSLEARVSSESKESNFKDAADAYQHSTQQFCGAFGEGFLALGITYQHLKEFENARKTYLEVQKRFPNTKLAEQAMERLRKLP